MIAFCTTKIKNVWAVYIIFACFPLIMIDLFCVTYFDVKRKTIFCRNLFLFRISRSLLRCQFTSAARAKHTLPELPYSYDALAPVLSSELLQVHHKKHHQVSDFYCNFYNIILILFAAHFVFVFF